MILRQYLGSIKRKVLTFYWIKKSTQAFKKEKDIPANLHIGAGYRSIEGWLNTDYQYSNNSNIYFLDATKEFPFATSKFEFVFSEHMIEHISRPEAAFMLTEVYRVLKPGGVLRIVTRDLKFFISQIDFKSEDSIWCQ